MTIYTPYTYLIGWSKQNIFYYGVRYGKTKSLYESGCHPDEFWITYFTSSIKVKSYRQLYGEPDILQIRKTFSDGDAARNWENKVLRRMSVVDRGDFLNLTDNISPRLTSNRQPRTYDGCGRPKGCECPIKGKKSAHHPEIGRIMFFGVEETLPTGWVWGSPKKSKEHNEKNRKSHLGKRHSNESRLKMSNTRKDGRHSGGKNGRSKRCLVEGVEFECLGYAAKHFNVSRGTIRKWIKDRTHGSQLLHP